MAEQPITFTTPKGVAQYPWLSKPDTKFSEEGEYKVNLILPKQDAIPVLKQINQVFAENVERELKKANGKEIKKAPPPYSEEFDEAGQPTGNVILRFKSKAAYKPSIFDSKGMPMVDSNIWGGSEIKINGSIAPYYTSLIGAGVALRLRAVQVIKYVQGGADANRFGFAEEDGYVHTESAPQTFEDTSISAETSLGDTAEPTVRAETTIPPQPADDLSDIINQWAKG
jgi:hypothetical protein